MLQNVVPSVTAALCEVMYNYTCCIARTGGTHSYHRVDVQLDALTCARIRSTVLQVACGPGAPVTLKPLGCLQVQATAHDPTDRPIDRSRSSAAEWIGRSDRRWWRWEVAWHHGDWMFNDEWVLLIRLFVFWLVASTYVLCLAYYNTTVSATLVVSIEWCVVECREVWLKSRGLF